MLDQELKMAVNYLLVNGLMPQSQHGLYFLAYINHYIQIRGLKVIIEIELLDKLLRK